MRRALVCAGGGAKGMYQVGALRELHERGYEWASLYGVSVGALNVAGLAQLGIDGLEDVWQRIKPEDCYRKYSWPKVALRVLMGKTGVYDNTPLLATIKRELGTAVMAARVGYVRLDTGEYVSAQATPESVWASTTIPVLWEPVEGIYVDGGVRNMTPLSEALYDNPAEVVVILCNRFEPEPVPKPKNLLEAGKRALDLAMNEIGKEDVQQFIRINDLVRQAARHNLTLLKPDGTPFRYASMLVVEPSEPLGDTLDFSAVTRQRRYDLGRADVAALLDERRVA